MDRPRVAQAVIERVRVLQGGIVEEFERIMKDRHADRLTTANDVVNGMARNRNSLVDP